MAQRHVIEEGLNSYQIPNEYRTEGNLSCILAYPDPGDSDFQLIISFLFQDEALIKILIEEQKFFATYTPKFLIKHVLKEKNYLFRYEYENKFSCTAETLSVSFYDPILFIEEISSTVTSFLNFSKDYKKIENEYRIDPDDWVRQNMAHKLNSLATRWHLVKGCNFLELTKTEYETRTGKPVGDNFREFTIVVFPLNTQEVDVKILIKPREGDKDPTVKMATERVSKANQIKDVLTYMYSKYVLQQYPFRVPEPSRGQKFNIREYFNIGTG
jgi:hypothetical protein